MQTIAEPKVFISYAWGTEEYQEKVLQFCTRLQTECGVQVVIDKWAMVAGNDTMNFMERSVKDPDIHFVLMLLDKNYAAKADARKGGVGTETQIISPQVYADAEQSKFVPIVFERDEDGAVPKPVFLNSRYHFDLTAENANEEFMRLVRHLYGQKTYPVPPVGKKPDWVTQAPIISSVISGPLYTIKNSTDVAVIKSAVKKALSNITSTIYELAVTSSEDRTSFNETPQKYLDYLDQFRTYRDAVIAALDSIKHRDYFEDMAAEFFENYKAAQDNGKGGWAYSLQATQTLLHEIFLYTIALLWEAEQYSKIRNLILRTYFTSGSYRYPATADITDIIYSGTNAETIDNAKNKVDNKNYHCGVAQLWTEHVVPGFTLEQLVFADLLVHNIDILEKPKLWYWFPLLYPYGLGNRVFMLFAVKLKSVYQLKRYEGLLGTSSKTEVQAKFQKMKELTNQGRYRYPNLFDSAPLILDHVKVEEIGTIS